jgi:hypothetical protein
MSGGKKQQKNRRDSIKDWRFHVLPPETVCRAAVYYVNQPGLRLLPVRGLRATRKQLLETGHNASYPRNDTSGFVTCDMAILRQLTLETRAALLIADHSPNDL